MTNLTKNQWKTYKRIIAFVRYISLSLSRHGVKVGPGPQDPGPQDPGTRDPGPPQSSKLWSS